MAKQKDDPLASSHFTALHQVGPFAKGTLLTADEVNASFGRTPGSNDEVHDKYLKTCLKRLLDLGAITPAEAPEEPEEAPPPAPEKPEPEPPKSAPHPPHGRPEPPKR
jgi:hypothetical protein